MASLSFNNVVFLGNIDGFSEDYTSDTDIDIGNLNVTLSGGGAGAASQTIAYMYPGNLGESGTVLFKTGTGTTRPLWQKFSAPGGMNFAKEVFFVFAFNFSSSSLDINELDAQNVIRVQLGKLPPQSVGQITTQGIGFELSGRSFKLLAHNGTSLSSSTAADILEGDKIYIIKIHSDGLGNANLFINGVLSASTSGAPTGTNNNSALVVECSNGALTNNPVYIMRRKIAIRS